MDDRRLQGPEQPLDGAVGLEFRDQDIAWGDVPDPDLLLEVPDHEAAALVVAQRKAAGAGDQLDDRSKNGVHRCP
jgi:hypothetical protein